MERTPTYRSPASLLKGIVGVVLILCCLIVGKKEGYGQHSPFYSQYMFNGLALNPAYTGSRDVLTLNTAFRYQWVGFKGAPESGSFALHTPLKDGRSNLGMILMNDRFGVSNNSGAYGTYAFRMRTLKEDRLSFGLLGGIALLKDRWSQVNTNQGGDDVFNGDSPLFVVPRVGFGVYYDTPKWYLGMSTPQILELESDSRKAYTASQLNYRSWFLSGGYLFKLNPDLKLKPSFLVKYIQDSPVQADLNAMLIIQDRFWVGASYRTGAAVVGLFEFHFNDQFRIAYSFDQPVHGLINQSSGSNELSLRYEFGYKIKGMSPRYF